MRPFFYLLLPLLSLAFGGCAGLIEAPLESKLNSFESLPLSAKDRETLLAWMAENSAFAFSHAQGVKIMQEPGAEGRYLVQIQGTQKDLAGGLASAVTRDGHIAFNEPGSAVDSRTRAVELTEDTIKANSRFFGSIDDVPRHAITMGIGTILEARRIVLMATGEEKADAVKRAIEDDSNESHPASLLQRHPDVTFVLDRDAACELSSCQST